MRIPEKAKNVLLNKRCGTCISSQWSHIYYDAKDLYVNGMKANYRGAPVMKIVKGFNVKLGECVEFWTAPCNKHPEEITCQEWT